MCKSVVIKYVKAMHASEQTHRIFPTAAAGGGDTFEAIQYSKNTEASSYRLAAVSAARIGVGIGIGIGIGFGFGVDDALLQFCFP